MATTACKHCEGTGTCHTVKHPATEGAEVSESSCLSCVKASGATAEGDASPKGLPCSVCGGQGVIVLPEPARRASSAAGFLTMAYVVLCLLALAYAARYTPAYEAEILASLLTLAGAVLGYLFGRMTH